MNSWFLKNLMMLIVLLSLSACGGVDAFMSGDDDVLNVGGIYSVIPTLDTRPERTQDIVINDDTLVLRGSYDNESAEGKSEEPSVGDVSLLGYPFASKARSKSKVELLVFVTPKILKESLRLDG